MTESREPIRAPKLDERAPIPGPSSWRHDLRVIAQVVVEVLRDLPRTATEAPLSGNWWSWATYWAGARDQAIEAQPAATPRRPCRRGRVGTRRHHAVRGVERA